jgi:polar amino acid transport system substrate-binding protein
LEADVKRISGVRLLGGHFIDQTSPDNAKKSRRGACVPLLFIEEIKRSGFVAEALARHRIKGTVVTALSNQ